LLAAVPSFAGKIKAFHVVQWWDAEKNTVLWGIRGKEAGYRKWVNLSYGDGKALIFDCDLTAKKVCRAFNRTLKSAVA
jgi:hypothetical protein